MPLPTSFTIQQASAQEQEKSRSIEIATWVLFGTIVAIFVARQVMKAFVFRKVALDDFFMLAATVFAIGLSITTLLLASKGLGVPDPLTVQRADALMKGYYASEFLYISSLCFSKLSLVVLFYTVVASQRIHRRVVLGFGVLLTVWSIVSVIVVALQCQLPKPWQMMTLRCFNTRAFWMAYCIVDMSTEVAIVMLSLHLVVYLHLDNSRKIAVVACFAPRALVAAASLVRLIWLYPVTPHDEPEYRLWLPAILSQVHVCLSICTACIPFMVPFFRSRDVSRRRTFLFKSPDVRTDERDLRTPSSLWFRRQGKSQTINSWDSTAVASLQYERVAQASPHIPTPQPISPLTPPHYSSRPGTAGSSSLSRQGLSINIPERSIPLPSSTDITGPQTASSSVLSPTCTPLLTMYPSFSTINVPTPPPKTHSPKPPTASSFYSSRGPSPVSPVQQPRFTLFPQQVTPERRYSPDLRQGSFVPTSIPPIRSPQSSKANNDTNHQTSRPSYTMIERSRSPNRLCHNNEHAPKFSTAPRASPLPGTSTSPTSGRKHFSIQELNSPMGAAINHYFQNAAPEAEPSLLTSIAAPRSGHHQLNYQVLAPADTLGTQKPLPRSPLPGTSPELVRGELALPRDSLVINRALRSPSLPLVQDVRSSPRIVVRHI